MAVWLANQVGPSGQVVATDIDASYLKRLQRPNLEVLEHNILNDPLTPLDPGSFDLVCSRLLLFHLRDRQEDAIRQMAKCLRPGGWLIDEEGDWGTVGPVDPSHPIFGPYHAAWRDGDWWVDRGYDPVFGRKLPALFERCGLEDIRVESATAVVRGGSPWARWYGESNDVIHKLGSAAVTDRQQREHELITSAFADPSVWLMRETLHTCWGKRPS
jgi:SAM-dependent methyltransferase